jgi:uncharacterized protein (TIGR02145 family)
LGGGTATAGTFANLPWANGNDKFLKLEMDAQGGTNYQPMGTTQLVSVPYALAAVTAKTADVAKELQIGALVRGNNGETYSLTIGATGPTWACIPPVTAANAGPAQLKFCASSITLTGNTPSNGIASWSILSGSGGSLGTANAPSTTFTGVRGNSYSLRYSISNACGSSSDTVAVILATLTTPASAGPDQLNLSGTTAILAANPPSATSRETGTWSILAGSGGSFSNNSNPTATFTKGTDTAYTLIWTMTGPCGSSRDTVNLRFPAPVGSACGQAVTYAGESYPIVQIGTQCWFAKNLNVGTMINFSSSADNQTNNSTIEKYCYDNDTANCTTYGGLYQWAEAVQYQNGATNDTSPSPAFSGNVKGICPMGWHLPSDGEWSSLETFLGGSFSGGALKSTSSLWTSPNYGATNSSGFSALPAGASDTTGSYNTIGISTSFWTSTEFSSILAYGTLLNYNFSFVQGLNDIKFFGRSIRCIRD